MADVWDKVVTAYEDARKAGNVDDLKWESWEFLPEPHEEGAREVGQALVTAATRAAKAYSDLARAARVYVDKARGGR
jgi:hypothetical protein